MGSKKRSRENLEVERPTIGSFPMASDEETVHRVLTLLDRNSVRSLNRAVLQFKQHSQRFHESISELKSLKPPTGKGVVMCKENVPLKPAECLSNTFAYNPSQDTQKCTPGNSHTNPAVDKENHDSKKYSLRPRSAKTLHTNIHAPQRITRSRAKQTVAEKTATSSNIDPEQENTNVNKDFIQITEQKRFLRQQEISYVDLTTEVATSNHKGASSCLLSETLSLAGASRICMDVQGMAFSDLKHDLTEKGNKDRMLSIHEPEFLQERSSSVIADDSEKASLNRIPGQLQDQSDPNSCEEKDSAPICIKDGDGSNENINMQSCLKQRKKNHQCSVNIPHHVLHLQEAISISPCQSTTQHDLSYGVKDSVQYGVDHESVSLPGTKEPVSIVNEELRAMHLGHSISHKRKFSVNGASIFLNNTRNRFSPSCDSPLYEAFVVDEIPVYSTSTPHANISKDLSSNDRKKIMFKESKEPTECRGNTYGFSQTACSQLINPLDDKQGGRKSMKPCFQNEESKDDNSKGNLEDLTCEQISSEVKNSPIQDVSQATTEDRHPECAEVEDTLLSKAGDEKHDVNQQTNPVKEKQFFSAIPFPATVEIRNEIAEIEGNRISTSNDEQNPFPTKSQSEMKDAVTEECCEECTDHKDDVMSTENHEQSQKNQSRILEQEIGFGTEGEQFAFSIHSQTKLHLDENQENLSHLKVPFSNSMWVTEENVIPDMTEKPSEDLRLEGFDCECQSVSCYNQVSKDESSTSIIGSLAQSFFEQNNMGTDGGHLECAEVEGNGTCFSTDVQHCNIEANTSARPSLSKSHHEKKNIAIAARHPECTEFEGNGTCFSADEQRCSIEANTSASPSLAKSHHQKKDIAIIEGHVEFAEVEGNGTCLSVDVQHYNIGVNTFEEEISFEREFFPSASPAELQFKQDACSLHLKEISFNAQDIEDAEKKSTLSSRCNDSNHEIETVPDHNVETEHTSAFPSLTKSYFEKKDIAIVKGHVECVEIEGNGTCLSIDVPHCNIDPNILEQEHSDTKQKDDVLSNCNKFPFSNPIHGTGDYAIEGVEGNATHYSRLDDYNHMDQHIGDCNHINSYKYLGSLAPQHICDYFNSSSHSPPCSLQNEQNVRISLCCHDSPIAQEEKSAFSEAEAERIISKPGLASSSIEIPNIDYAVHNSTEMPNLEYDISVKNDEYETRTERQHSFKSLSSRKSFECCKLGGLTFSEAEEVGSPAQTLHSTNPRISTQVTSATPITSISRIAASSAAISVRLTPEMKDTENCRYQQEVEMTFGQDAKNEVLYPTCRAPQRSSGHNDLACMSPSKEKQKLSIDLSSCTQDVEKIESLEVESINGGNENQMDCSELPLLDQSLKGNTAENDDGNIENEMDCTESPGQPHCLNGNNSGDDNNDKETSMDCEESPDLPHSLKEINAKEWKVQETERIIDCKSTPECDEGVLKFNQLLALGTVNSSRRKRPRSPTICTEESCKDFKRIKLFSAEKSCHFDREELPDAVFLRSPAFRSNSSMYGIPYFSPIRRFQNTFDKNFEDISGKTFEMEGFDNFQEQLMDSKQLPKSSMQLPYLQKDYVDTPRMNSANIGFIGRAANKQLLDCNLITQIEEDEKENQCPKTLTRGRSYRNTSMQSDIHTSANSRKALSHVNHSLGQVESPHRRYNLATGTGSFLSFVQQKQQASFPYPSGKREVKVKALEAAEFARKQEEKRENERRMRRLENNDAKGMDSDSVKEKLQNNTAPVALKGVTEKVKKVADLKMKMDQEKARKQEMEQKKKEDERKKKEAELANKKRKREEAERRDREEKRKRVEEAQRMRKEQEERQRIELEEKELKRKMQEERERERKAHEDEAKKQRRLEKEKEAERRRKQDQDLKVAKYMEKQAERKRKEAMTRTQGNEDDDFIIQTTKEKKLSHISTDSLAVSISADWGTQFESKIRTRSQTSEVSCGFQMPSHSTPVYNSDKLTSVLESELFLSAQPVVSEGSSTANMIIGSYAQLIHPDDEIKSYEISPYKSSSDDDEDDDEPKKPVPLWARKENLLQQLAWQQDIDPDQIFSSEKTCNLSQIFGTTGSRRCYNFTQRSTSGDWFEDHATWKEQVDYKKAMGYM